MNIKFCGAAGTVTGSAHLITFDDGYKLLLDCGLFQGEEEDTDQLNRHWGFEPRELDAVVLSHAHIDHCGRLPKLVKDGFRGQIYCTYATRDLSTIMLNDSAFIQEQDALWMSKKLKKSVKPLYKTEDVLLSLHHLRGCKYGKWYKIREHLSVYFADAGHILGSASVVLEFKLNDGSIQRIGFTGDIGRPERPVLKDPIPIMPVDYLICESTYGGRKHEAAPTEDQKLREVIYDTCVAKRGKLIIPAFSVGRTQELLYKFHGFYLEGRLPDIPIYVDSPLATSATDIYRQHPECFDEETFHLLTTTEDPFGFEHVKFVRDVNESKALNHSSEPAIIISASGMATAGRVRHHIYHAIDKPENTILIVGFCAPGTLGERLLKLPLEIKLFNQELSVRADIESLNSMSAHGDEDEMLDFLQLQEKDRLRQLFLVHGIDEGQEPFKKRLESEGFKKVVIPRYNEVINLEC
jgi:metallo-beta-lactamase family protein